MSNWKLKSDESISVASHLIAEYSNQSVHCSYYACVQLIYHIFHTQLNESEENLNNGITKENYIKSLSLADQNKKIGTHVWLQKELFRSLNSRATSSEIDIEKIMGAIGTLATVRVIADYKSEIIMPNRAKGIYDKAILFINSINSIY